MYITGIGLAAPAKLYRQAECWEALKGSGRFQGLTARSRSILRKVLLSDNGIETRHLAFNDLTEAFDLRPDVLHRRFLTNAPDLAERAAREALGRAATGASDIDALLISTCTGYLCPGLTSYVAERLGLRPDVLCLDLVGQGCGAALPNLRAAAALLDSRRGARALCICVEVCSAAFYLDDDPGVLVSACLFGDGAAAAVVAAEPLKSGRSVRWHDSQSALHPEHRDLLRFEQRGGMLRNILSLEVPAVAARHAAGLFKTMAARNGVDFDQVKGWILHAGGKNVLDALRAAIGLTEEQTACSAAVLRGHGNVSSPFVLFTLDRALNGGTPPGWWWMSSFGAGFSCGAVFLEVR